MVISHNMTAMFTANQLNISSRKKTKSAESLSSGYRINRAADDAAGLKISEKMRGQIRGLKRGSQNTQEGISWVQVGDGAMNEMIDIVQRIRELAVQASNDTNNIEDREAINDEIKELKKEINRISCSTEYNKQQVFDCDDIMMDVKGAPNDLQIYNSHYDNATGKVEYGGFILDGNRVSWDTVSAGMVEFDTATGKQMFTGGEYDWADPTTGTIFHFSCQAGDEVPKITRKINISADSFGISIDGTRHSWFALKNEDGNPPLGGELTQGVWELEHNGATLAIFVPDDYDFGTMATKINLASEHCSWQMSYTGSQEVKAVDATVMKNLRISNVTAQKIINNQLSLTVQADESSIWLTDSADANKTPLNGSAKTWEELGIKAEDWNSGNKISRNFTYQYSDSEGIDDTFVSFDFVLDDVTSLDSVIDGLDGMQISGKTITTHYGAVQDVTLDNNIKSASVLGGNDVYFTEEVAFGRDFDQSTVINISNNNVQYDKDTGEISLVFPDASGDEVLKYQGTAKEVENYLQQDLSTYLSNILLAKDKAALSDTTVTQVAPQTIRDVLGTDNITPDGYLSDVVKITDTMYLTDGADGNDLYKPGTTGKEYPGACIDFAAIGSGNGKTDIYQLVGTGFNSDCKTCDNYYSIRFEDFSNGNALPENTTEKGYGYTIRETKRINSSRSNYTLQIDINSLKANGVTDGAGLAKALVEIASECLDMHFTQYAADGSKFWIYDDREQTSDAQNAMFDTVPMPQVNVDEFGFVLSTDDGRLTELLYKYDFTDVQDWVQVNMAEDANGDYVKDANGGYRKYNDATDSGIPDLQRYKKETSYLDRSDPDNSKSLGSIQDVVNRYTQHAMDKMLGNTKVTLNAQDYTYINVSGDENENVAVKSVFDSTFWQLREQEGIYIQNSGTMYDSVRIPKFQVNTMVLNLYKAGTKTWDDAQETIGMSDDALRILTGMRSAYGAWQNRLEHIYANSLNAEENTQASESRLRDTDMATEMTEYSKHKIIEQAGQSMLAQANQSAQGTMSLLMA